MLLDAYSLNIDFLLIGVEFLESKPNNLTFDISEKVVLKSTKPAIERFLELDIFPDIEILENENEIKLSGQLHLKGVYFKKDSEGETEQLLYNIPVEISLPHEKANLDSIYAEIVSFDYQIMSPFELKINSSLAIHGLLADNLAKSETEEKTEFKETPQEVEDIKVDEISQDEEEVMVVSKIEDNAEKNLIEEEILDSEHSKDLGEKNDAKDENVRNTNIKFNARLESKDVTSFINEEIFTENEKVMKENLDIPEENIEEESVKNSFLKESSWLQVLIRKYKDKDSFVCMRMAILQEEDTVSNLADKYNVPVDKIMKVNNLEDEFLQKGKVIYIPTKFKLIS